MDYSNGKTCPYCEDATEYTDSRVVYGKSYGMIYLCVRCMAYVGVHKGTDKALGRVADKKLRHAKICAHDSFDKLVECKVYAGTRKSRARKKGYKWLSDQMGIAPEDTHIGMFDVDQCNQVVALCKPYLSKVGV